MSEFNNLFAIALLLQNKEIEQKFLSKVEGFESVIMAEMRDYLRSDINKRLENYQKKRPDPAISEILELLGNAAYVTVYAFRKNWKRKECKVRMDLGCCSGRPVIPQPDEEFLQQYDQWKAEKERKECRKAEAEGEAIASLIDAIDGLNNRFREPTEVVNDIAEMLFQLIESGEIPHVKFEVKNETE